VLAIDFNSDDLFDNPGYLAHNPSIPLISIGCRSRVAMDTTSPSLLERLRYPGEEKAWDQFVTLYSPLLYRWARGRGLQEADAGDLVQDVLVRLVRKLPEFRYDPGKSFRAWLRTVALNCWRDRERQRAGRPNEREADGPGIPLAPDDTEVFADEEYRGYLVRRALELMQAEFRPTTWKACWENVVSGKTAAEVGVELGLSPGAVYVARSRVLARLRKELRDLLD
jgi:RNA polymerase sigma-70 factor (ECF subfamily)